MTAEIIRSVQELTARVIRLENLQQDPTAYRHTSLLLAEVNSHKAAVDHLREEVDRWKNDLGACDASRLASEDEVDRLRAKVRQLQGVRRAAKRMVKAQMKKRRVLRKR